eukprot:gene2899-3606_t
MYATASTFRYTWSSRVSKTGEYYYRDEHYSNGRPENLASRSSALYRTLEQATDRNKNYGSLAYNDEPIDDHGHSKGFVIWDQDTGAGIFVSHSLPNFPRLNMDGTKIDISGLDWLSDHTQLHRSLNQHFLCFTFQDPSIISTYLAHLDVPLYYSSYDNSRVPNVPSAKRVAIDSEIRINFSTWISGNNILIERFRKSSQCNQGRYINKCIFNFAVEFSANGEKALGLPGETRFFMKLNPNFNDATQHRALRKFVVASNGYDLWSKVQSYYNIPFFASTMLNRGGNPVFPNINKDIVNAYDVNVIDLLGKNTLYNGQIYNLASLYRGNIPRNKQNNRYDVGNCDNHSKLFFPIFPSETVHNNRFCVGDLNRHFGQQKRGGGAICFPSYHLSLKFNRAVSKYLLGNDKTLSYPWGVYTRNSFTLYDDQRQPLRHVKVRIAETLFKEDPTITPPETPSIIQTIPFHTETTSYNGVHQFFMNSLRSRLPQSHTAENNFPTKYVRSGTLYNPLWILDNDQYQICNSRCEFRRDILYLTFNINSNSLNQEVHYPSNTDYKFSYNVYTTEQREFILATNVPRVQRIYRVWRWMSIFMSYFSEEIRHSFSFPKMRVSISSSATKSEFLPPRGTRTYSLIVLAWNPDTASFDIDTLSYLMTQFALYEMKSIDFHTQNDNWGPSLILAISKYISSKAPYFDDGFTQDFINNFPIFDMPTSYRIERTLDPDSEGLLRRASALYDLLDADNDNLYGDPFSKDKNSDCRISLTSLIISSSVNIDNNNIYYILGSILRFFSFNNPRGKPINEDILFYNKIYHYPFDYVFH